MRALLGTAVLLFSLAAFAQSEPVTLVLITDGANEAAGTIALRATLRNESAAAASDVTVRIGVSSPDLATVEALDAAHCSVVEGMSLCSVPTLAPRQSVTFDYVLHFPRHAGRVIASAIAGYELTPGEPRSAHASVAVTLWRSFTVTNTDDDGAGSLRAAIGAINADPACADLPCRVVFAIAPAAAGEWRTIALQSPLPELVAGDVAVDATTQANTNPLGPDVELLGTALRTGSGLRIRAGRAEVRGMAIGGFPHDGIFCQPIGAGSVLTIEGNYIGVDAAGTRAVANGGRGIVTGEGLLRDSSIRGNVVSGNARSGLFIDSGADLPLVKELTIVGNRIGVAAASDDPIGNGASGIFIGPRAQQVAIDNNVIGSNRHMGVAVARTATWISSGENRIFGHPGLAYDIGLDGPDASAPAVIESAHYDPATGITTITGRGEPSSFPRFEYRFYANREVDGAGYAEAERPIGSTVPDRDGRFRLNVHEDLRGQFIDAQILFRYDIDTSVFETSGEFLRAVPVE
ncbi:MAG TPA: right-handed parallel beta-helix repeat-containing protein [Thermoanaerobaculia bacterium]|jgi:hypothetical protein